MGVYMIRLSSVLHAADNRPSPITFESIDEMANRLEASAQKHRDKDGPALCGATFKAAVHSRSGELGVWRRTECVDEVHALILDVDHGVDDLARFLGQWPYQAVGWSTWSDGVDGRTCLRLVLPLAAPVDAETFGCLWRWAQDKAGGVLDRACKDPTHIYYTPRAPNPVSKTEPWVRTFHGPRLDAGSIARLCERFAAPVHTPRAYDPRYDAPDEGEVIDALQTLDPDCGHDEWLHIGMAVHDATGGSSRGLDIWDGWSARSSKYKPGECNKRWRSFDRGAGVTKATLFGMARDAGWRPSTAPQRPERPPAGDGTVEGPRGREVIEWSTHTGLARVVAKNLRRKGPIVEDESKVWRYEAPAWVEVTQPELCQEVTDLDRMPVAAGVDDDGNMKTKPLRVNKSTIDGVVGVLRILRGVSRQGFFAEAPIGMQFSDCFVGIEGGEFVTKPPLPAHRQRAALPFAYNPDAPCPRWEEALGSWFDGAEDAQARADYLQEFVGAIMAGTATKHQLATVLLGEGQNGKSSFIETIQRTFPEGFWATVEPQDFGDEYRLAMLAGVRANFSADIPSSEVVDSSKFKAVVAGDTVTARHIRQEPFQFHPIAGHLFSANKLPRTRDFSQGFWRRFVVVEFPNKFDVDHGFNDRLAEETQGIVSWALRGLARLMDRGIMTPPPSSEALVGRWRTVADVVALWVEECTEKAEGRGTAAKQLFEDFDEWRDKNRYKQMTSRTFYERLQTVVGQPKRRASGKWYPLSLLTQNARLSVV